MINIARRPEDVTTITRRLWSVTDIARRPGLGDTDIGRAGLV